MTNKELSELIKEFIEEQDNSNKDEWYATNKGFASGVMDLFKEFLERKGKKLP